uniref:Uncharacterized protein n=1 Tax=Pararge aegeria TaxID=116150 RepID=S4PDP6_9NEOP
MVTGQLVRSITVILNLYPLSVSHTHRTGTLDRSIRPLDQAKSSIRPDQTRENSKIINGSSDPGQVSNPELPT